MAPASRGQPNPLQPLGWSYGVLEGSCGQVQPLPQDGRLLPKDGENSRPPRLIPLSLEGLERAPPPGHQGTALSHPQLTPLIRSGGTGSRSLGQAEQNSVAPREPLGLPRASQQQPAQRWVGGLLHFPDHELTDDPHTPRPQLSLNLLS